MSDEHIPVPGFLRDPKNVEAERKLEREARRQGMVVVPESRLQVLEHVERCYLWSLPILTGADDAEAMRKTFLVAEALLEGYTEHAAIVEAMKLEKERAGK